MNPTVKREDRLSGEHKGGWARSLRAMPPAADLRPPSQSPGNWGQTFLPHLEPPTRIRGDLLAEDQEETKLLGRMITQHTEPQRCRGVKVEGGSARVSPAVPGSL